MTPVRGRALVSLWAAACLLALTGTGLLLYFLKHSLVTAAVHTSFGAVFLLIASLHVRNNLGSLKGYAHKSGDRGRAFLRKEIYLALIPATALLAGLLYEVPGFSAVYDWGNELRARQENKEESQVLYQHLETNPAGKGATLVIDVKKGSAFGFPLFAVWIEDTDGRFLQTLYVSNVIGTSRFRFGKKENGDWVPDIVRRPEALPYWGHRRGVQARDGYFLPDPDSPVPDAVSGATPTESFKLTTRPDQALTKFRIYLEVNQSFDWNDYYSETRFPDDPIYSGSGQNGQPSVVYAATVDLTQDTRYYALNAVGHGHPGGHDGELHTDMANLTTALEIVDGVLVRVTR